MSNNLATLKKQRDQLQTAIHSGVQSVSINGQSTTFASMRDMRAVLADIEQQIAMCEGSEQRKPRVSSISMHRGAL